jgi:hypothetical protein
MSKMAYTMPGNRGGTVLFEDVLCLLLANIANELL